MQFLSMNTKQLLNLVITKYVVICQCVTYQIIDLLDTDKFQYFAQIRPIIVK